MDIKNYYELFTDMWKHFKKYSTLDGTQAFWKAYCEDVSLLDKKYKHSELFQNLILAVTREILRIERR